MNKSFTLRHLTNYGAFGIQNVLAAGAGVLRSQSAAEFLPPAPAGQQWKLIWHDEFDGPTLDETKCNRLGDWKRRDGWWMKEDAYLNGKGSLVLRTCKTGKRFTCGAVSTRGKFEHAFGYYVARIKLPRQPGHWPAFWLMAPGVNTVGNAGRDGTEIDIVEVPWRDGRLTSNLHWDGYGKDHKSDGTNRPLAEVSDASRPDAQLLLGLSTQRVHRAARRPDRVGKPGLSFLRHYH